MHHCSRAALAAIALTLLSSAHASTEPPPDPPFVLAVLGINSDAATTFTTPDGATVTQWAAQGLNASLPLTIHNGDTLNTQVVLSHPITFTSSGFTSFGPQLLGTSSQQFTVTGSVLLALNGQAVATLQENSLENGFTVATDAYVPSGQTLTFDTIWAIDTVTGLSAPMTLTQGTLTLYQAASSVPEANTAVTLGLGLGVLALVRRQKHRPH